MKKLKLIDWIALVILIIGGINGLIIGLLNFDIITAIFGRVMYLDRVLYVIIGAAAIYAAILLPRLSRKLFR